MVDFYGFPVAKYTSSSHGSVMGMKQRDIVGPQISAKEVPKMAPGSQMEWGDVSSLIQPEKTTLGIRITYFGKNYLSSSF